MDKYISAHLFSNLGQLLLVELCLPSSVTLCLYGYCQTVDLCLYTDLTGRAMFSCCYWSIEVMFTYWTLSLGFEVSVRKRCAWLCNHRLDMDMCQSYYVHLSLGSSRCYHSRFLHTEKWNKRWLSCTWECRYTQYIQVQGVS